MPIRTRHRRSKRNSTKHSKSIKPPRKDSVPTHDSPHRRAAAAHKVKRLQTKRRIANQRATNGDGAEMPIARTSQALRQAQVPSGKRARKERRKMGFEEKRRMEREGEVVMKDVGRDGGVSGDGKDMSGRRGAVESDNGGGEKMDVDVDVDENVN